MQGNMTQLWSAISVESRDFIMNGRDLWWKVDERLRYVMTGQDFIMNGRDILWQVKILIWWSRYIMAGRGFIMSSREFIKNDRDFHNDRSLEICGATYPKM